jgi:hypothetical protein
MTVRNVLNDSGAALLNCGTNYRKAVSEIGGYRQCGLALSSFEARKATLTKKGGLFAM